MKYKKIVTITLVAILICTSISAVAMAKVTVNETKDAFRGRLFDLLNKLSANFPIIAKLFDIIKPEKPVEPQKPDCDATPPKLDFDISVGEIYTLEEPIVVEATLTNMGHSIVRVSEMSFKVGTLDYFIRTPEGYELQYVGPIDHRFMEIWTLFPEESRSIDIDIKCGLFNMKISSGCVSPGVSDPYEFIPGVYAVRAMYKSFYPIPTLTSEVSSIWCGELETEPYLFEITK